MNPAMILGWSVVATAIILLIIGWTIGQKAERTGHLALYDTAIMASIMGTFFAFLAFSVFSFQLVMIVINHVFR